MSNYIIRLDDASDYMDIQKWIQIEELLDKYKIKPLFGIIPQNNDESLISKYTQNHNFWNIIHSWIDKGWVPAMHGYEHRYLTKSGGINPIHKRSEFAGLPYEEQAEKIRKGYEILVEQNIKPEIFFAPSHTFDNNTLKALAIETPIRIISDTIAWNVYKDGIFWFIPQQSGRVRKLPFKTVTFCYHPNTMNDNLYSELENFIKKNITAFKDFHYEEVLNSQRKLSILDRLIRNAYFTYRK